MGGGSSRQSTSTNSTTTYTSDQSYKDYSTTVNNSLDGGAIEDAFNFASGASDNLLSGINRALNSVDNSTDGAMRVSLGALDYYDKINRNSLSVLESSTKNALDFASNATKGESQQAAEFMSKNAVYIGLGGLAFAYLMARGK